MDKLKNKQFLQYYYIDKNYTLNQIKELLKNKYYISTSISTLSKNIRKLGIKKDSSIYKRNLDYNKSFLNDKLLEAIDGFLLGDGSINCNGKQSTLNNNARLQSGLQHYDFANYFKYFFKIYHPKIFKVQSKTMSFGYKWELMTLSHPDIKLQYNRWYISGKKQPPKDIKITPLSVMMWYLGDGSLIKTNNAITLRLSTDSFSEENIDFLVKKLNGIGIDCERNSYKRIVVSTRGIVDFFKFIGNTSPINCYNYKFDLPDWRFESIRMKEAAKILGISYNKLSYLVKIGEIECFRLSEKGRPRFMKKHIEKAKKHLSNQDSKKEKIRKTNLKKYGVENIFSNKDIQKQIKKTNLEKYGVEYPLQNLYILNKTKETNIKKYGVDNPLKNDKIQEKVKETNLKKYGVEFPLQNSKIQKKQENTNTKKYDNKYSILNKNIKIKKEKTNTKKYGHISPLGNKDIKIKAIKNFKKSVKDNKNNKYNQINTLRQDLFWNYLKKHSLKDTCINFNLNYQSVTSAILSDEFKNKYYSTYHFPKQQKQKDIYNFLTNKGLDYIKFNDRSIIYPLELDIVDYNNKFAIEFNGSYWHSTKYLDKNFHLHKTKQSIKKSFYLIHIFEHNYIKKEKQYLNYLRYFFNNNKILVNIKDCIFNNSNALSYLYQYDIRDVNNNIIKFFNLEYKNKIIANLTISKQYNKYILSNYFINNDYQINNIFKKLFDKVKEWMYKQNINNIYFYSNLSLCDYFFLNDLNFNLNKEFPIDCFYFCKNKNHYLTKIELNNILLNKSEEEKNNWILKNNIFQIWNCGQREYIFKL